MGLIVADCLPDLDRSGRLKSADQVEAIVVGADEGVMNRGKVMKMINDARWREQIRNKREEVRVLRGKTN